MSDALEPFLCPQCKQLIKSDEKSIADHYSSKDHNKGLYYETPPQPQAQQQPGPQQPQPQYPPREYTPQGAYPTRQRWPEGNMPQIPATRYLSWWDQIKGMWYYYRKGMAWYGLFVALATIALLTRL